MRKLLTYLTIALFVYTLEAQQIQDPDIVLSELMSFNPARVGRQGGSAAIMTRQLFNQNLNHTVTSLSVNNQFFGDRVGIGILANQERTQFIVNNNVIINAAYFLQFTDNISLSLGLGGELLQSDISIPGNVYVQDREDPLVQMMGEGWDYDFNTGFDLQVSSVSVGASLFRLSSFSGANNLPTAIRAYANYSLPVRNNADKVDFGVLYTQYDGDLEPILAGYVQYWVFNDIYLGYMHKSSNAFSAFLGYVYGDRYHIGYNYENLPNSFSQLNYHSIGFRFLFNEQFYDRKGRGQSVPVDVIQTR